MWWLIAFTAGGLVWIVSGVDPLLWTIRGLIWLRAMLAAGAAVAYEAVHEWLDRVPAHLAATKQEVGQ